MIAKNRTDPKYLAQACAGLINDPAAAAEYRAQQARDGAARQAEIKARNRTWRRGHVVPPEQQV